MTEEQYLLDNHSINPTREPVWHTRLKTKQSEYRTFITDLERLLRNPQLNQKNKYMANNPILGRGYCSFCLHSNDLCTCVSSKVLLKQIQSNEESKADKARNKILEIIENKKNSDCYHDRCSECNGTSVKGNGTYCVHYISCPCKKCSPNSF